ncbi:aminodeoxychorismate lyase [Naasia lichenicola]|uniref:Aminodeoxychorismate lyase n=1 Tax=Naasia lichenicola TaxID=2565933 RepID=A0A4S4FN36_9MICO|nr:aminodeoxychorismate lyase [Naasia lichenicola]THG30656.1 aminodeoxychorismate lyase [Naasia lichenicola]THG31893.1 aminodeoxychorismate lyase [Naasia lichenicola]
MPSTALVLLNRPSLAAPAHVDGAPAHRFVEPDEPLVNVLDLGVTRGDGVFETISVGYGSIQALDAHIARFAKSAGILEMPEPDADAWRDAVQAAAAAIDPVDEAYVKTIMTRGIEGDDRPTGWAYAAPALGRATARSEGIRVVLLDRGYRHDVRQTSPWLLQGAKSLSYAVNRAVIREAHRRDADDAVFVSSDGYLLEGSTSNILLRFGDRLVTPGTNLGILAGTTQGDVFDFAVTQGLEVAYELLPIAALHEADAAWLLSSVRHAAPIRAVDGTPKPIDRTFTDALNDFLLHRTK